MPDATDSSVQSHRIAYLGFAEFDSGGCYRGAILIADEWGKPIEFRCTAPVKPNAVQRTLYGQTLMPHILVELVGVPLLRALEEKPSVVVIGDERFFDVRHQFDFPAVRLRRQGENVEMRGGGAEQRAQSVVLSSESGNFDPVVIEAHWKFPADVDDCQQALRELFGRMDLVEPFERLSKGLEYVHQQKVMAT